jgi:hypothetical protein
MPYYLYKSSRKGKKYMLQAHDKRIHFGAKGMRDYTLLNNPKSKFYLRDKTDRDKVREMYRARHSRDPINTPLTPGALSWFLLWNKPTLDMSLKSYSKRIGVDIINRT